MDEFYEAYMRKTYQNSKPPVVSVSDTDTEEESALTDETDMGCGCME